jgi:TRAP-type mannitol/chloroaromatic compound transport system substrate-binding protein
MRKTGFVIAVLAMTLTRPAFAEAPAETLSAILDQCEDYTTAPVDCERNLWRFVDVTDDDLISPAELTRASRILMEIAKNQAEQENAANIVYAVILGPLVAEIAVANFDYDDDGRLSRDEIYADFPEGNFKAFIAYLGESGQEALSDTPGLSDLENLLDKGNGADQGGQENDDRSEIDRSKGVALKMASSFPGELILLGDLGRELSKNLKDMSDDQIQLAFFEPGSLVPALEIFDAVSVGSIDAGWTASGYWAGKEPALQFFTAVPFGPPASEFLAWFNYGGGRGIYDEIYARHNVKGIICGVAPPEGGGWFREEIHTVEDLKGLRMRFFGLGAKVLDRVGVDTQLLAGGDIFPALELGTIDATEFSFPAIDRDLGFYEIAPHYYLPGWHQQSAFIDLIINMDVWDNLGMAYQAQFLTACAANVHNSIAHGDLLQADALLFLKGAGAEVHRWPPEIIVALKGAWREVAKDEAAHDSNFARASESLVRFRARYREWRELGYLE